MGELFRELESDFGLPALLEGEYLQSMPQARHLEQIGLALEHLTLARKQPSQDARRRGWRSFEELAIEYYSSFRCLINLMSFTLEVVETVK